MFNGVTALEMMVGHVHVHSHAAKMTAHANGSCTPQLVLSCLGEPSEADA
jgi:hypothetical protein